MDKEFFMDPNIQSENQFNNPFTWQTLENSLEIQTSQSQDYFLTTPPQIDHFESALSSMVSSPVASNSAISTDNFMMREVIGKLGSICNTNDIPHYINSGNCSTNNSCYTTPLSSPPKMGISMPIIDHLVGNPIGLPAMPGDPGFAERAARFSSFGSTSFNGRTSTTNHFVNRSCSNLGGGDGGNGKLHRVSSSPSLDVENGSNKKRKATISKGKGQEIEPRSQMPTNSNKVGENGDDSNAKRSKSEESNGKSEENKKPAEPQKDYIHVRARRGQATDSHSLAERVRREKISERMKLLQDLVPGCNRVTGKVLMLDEIINYVQSLQRQVEFLSMKLSNLNPTSELNPRHLFTKDEIQPNCPMTHPMYPTMVPTQYGLPHHNPLQDCITTAGSTFMDPLNPTLNQINHALHSPSIVGFSNCLPKLQSLCEGDLQSIVQMGFSQNENVYLSQTLHGTKTKEMKIEL